MPPMDHLYAPIVPMPPTPLGPHPTPPTPSGPHPSLPTSMSASRPVPHCISLATLQSFLPHTLPHPPPVCPCNTPNGSDSLCHLTADKIYHLFVNRRFRNYAQFCKVAKDSKFINGGNPTPSLGEFATIAKHSKGAPLPLPSKYLKRVHLDIAFGE